MTYVASISYGKDSLAMLEAIKILGLPLDRIVHAEVWATDTIQADLPPMVEFKAKADVIIKERYGIDVEHICALNKQGEARTYEWQFYQNRMSKKINGFQIYGFPIVRGAWCNNRLKMEAVNRIFKGLNEFTQYVGIAEDEPERLARLDGITKISPLHLIGWTEADCRKWCEENDLLSPLYETANRGGCWFCHNQGVGQLRLLRKTYPNLWQLLLKWDADSPVTFHADGHTVHDFDKRFQLEDDGILCEAEKFRWEYIKNPPLRQLSLFNEGVIFKE